MSLKSCEASRGRGNTGIRDRIYTRVVVQITMNGSCSIGSMVKRILKLSVVTESYFVCYAVYVLTLIAGIGAKNVMILSSKVTDRDGLCIDVIFQLSYS